MNFLYQQLKNINYPRVRIPMSSQNMFGLDIIQVQKIKNKEVKMENTNNEFNEIKKYFIEYVNEIKEIEKLCDEELQRLDKEEQQ